MLIAFDVKLDAAYEINRVNSVLGLRMKVHGFTSSLTVFLYNFCFN